MKILTEVLLKLKITNYLSNENIDDFFIKVWAEALEGLTDDNLFDVYNYIVKNGLPDDDGNKVYKITPAIFRQINTKLFKVKLMNQRALPEPARTEEDIKRTESIRQEAKQKMEALITAKKEEKAEVERAERQKEREADAIIEERNARLIEEARERMEAAKERRGLVNV